MDRKGKIIAEAIYRIDVTPVKTIHIVTDESSEISARHNVEREREKDKGALRPINANRLYTDE